MIEKIKWFSYFRLNFHSAIETHRSAKTHPRQLEG
jgi:hypothetical protein